MRGGQRMPASGTSTIDPPPGSRPRLGEPTPAATRRQKSWNPESARQASAIDPTSADRTWFLPKSCLRSLPQTRRAPKSPAPRRSCRLQARGKSDNWISVNCSCAAFPIRRRHGCNPPARGWRAGPRCIREAGPRISDPCKLLASAGQSGLTGCAVAVFAVIAVALPPANTPL